MSFKDFWTNQNNPSLPESDYLYGTRHIITLCLAAVLCVLLTLLFFRRSQKTKRILMYVLGGIFVFFEITSRVVNLIIADSYTVESVVKILLPMHMCSVMVWVLIIAIFTKSQFLTNFAVIGGLLATLAFLIKPAVGLNRVYMSFTCIYSTFTHMLGFVTAILLITLGFAKFEFKKIWQPILCFAIMFGYGALVDFVIFKGADYMYLRNDPLGLNLPIPYHIVYAGILLAYIFMFYFISWIVAKCKGKKKEKTA